MNNLSVEDLLKPRYKVIAPFPGMEKYSLMLDDILIGEDGVWENERTKRDNIFSPFTIKDFPEIFKKLEWWEERKESDMPEYAYDNENGGIGKVMNIIEGRGLCIGLRDNLVSWENCKPATKEEYNNQKIKP